jgi:hypothetical protein
MKAFLIDPYQRKIHPLDIDSDLSVWHQLLKCDCVDRAEIHRNASNTRAVDVWVDDEGLLKEPVPPTFKVRGYPNPLAGYGLLLGANLTSGRSIAAPYASAAEIAPLIMWERWERRLNPDDYFEELTRVPSWEHV